MAKYGPKAKKKIAKVLDEWKSGTLKSGRSDKRVASQKQAVAIGISEARHERDKVPKRSFKKPPGK